MTSRFRTNRFDLAQRGLQSAQPNTTPILCSLRHTRRQGRCSPSLGTISKNLAGIPVSLDTSSAAPVVDRLRIRQSTALPPNLIVPAFKTKWRGALRLSAIATRYAKDVSD